MPHIKIKSSAGSGNFHYTISTPKNPSAKSIDKTLPTVLFLHPVYIASDIFELQFADTNLRRFNLVALDLRSHGDTSAKVGSTYGRDEAASDIDKFLDALKISACHLVGVSMGSCISLQVAISYPAKVLSVTMISPLPLIEPQDVAEGRQEIHDCWCEAFQGKSVDKLALQDAVHGALQLGFNGEESSFNQALISRVLPIATKNWGSKSKLEEFRTVTVDFFVNRTAQTPDAVRKIRSPIKLVHCGADVAYGIDYSKEVLALLQGNGVNAQLLEVPDAAHFGNVSKPREINALIYATVIENSPNFNIPPASASVVSPFTAALVKAGYRLNDTDSDSD